MSVLSSPTALVLALLHGETAASIQGAAVSLSISTQNCFRKLN
jgi:hypothetical protein